MKVQNYWHILLGGGAGLTGVVATLLSMVLLKLAGSITNIDILNVTVHLKLPPGTLPIANGGTGATSAPVAENKFKRSLATLGTISAAK
jgi:hypothetical protein